jgi:hypothetical protein
MFMFYIVQGFDICKLCMSFRLVGFHGICIIYREPETLPASSFLVIQTAADRPMLAQSTAAIQNYGSNPSSPQPGLGGQTGRGASVVCGSVFFYLVSLKV